MTPIYITSSTPCPGRTKVHGEVEYFLLLTLKSLFFLHSFELRSTDTRRREQLYNVQKFKVRGIVFVLGSSIFSLLPRLKHCFRTAALCSLIVLHVELFRSGTSKKRPACAHVKCIFMKMTFEKGEMNVK